MVRVVLIDAHALIHRAYHAIPTLNTSSGLPVNAVYGFTKLLFRVINNLEPQFLVVAFDSKTPTFRHLYYKDYKANRPPAPDDLKQQFPLVRDIVKEMGLYMVALDGYEADDLLGTMVNLFKKKVKNDLEIFIVTGDWDAAQLVDGKVKLLKLQKKLDETAVIGVNEVRERFSIKDPFQVVDFKALQGDASDNIPGVKGIGSKTAAKILAKWQTIEEIYQHIEEIDKKYQEKLLINKAKAFLSKDLATIRIDVPIKIDFNECKWNGWNNNKVIAVLNKFEFNSLKKTFVKKSSKNKEKENDGQLSLI